MDSNGAPAGERKSIKLPSFRAVQDTSAKRARVVQPGAMQRPAAISAPVAIGPIPVLRTLPAPSAGYQGPLQLTSVPVQQTRLPAASAVVPRSSSTYSVQGNAILVNNNQMGNPLLKFLRNINYRHADVVPDYQINDRLAVVFLSLRFHKLQPLYIHGRIKALQRNFRAFLLCHCDVEDPVAPLADVTKLAIDSHCTLLVAFSPLECARYLEVLKAYEKKPADAIKARVETDYVGRLTSVLTSVRAVNKTDVATLGAQCHTLADLLQAPEATLGSVPGLGPTKVKRLLSTFTEPFFKADAAPAAAPGAAVPAGPAGGSAAGPGAARVGAGPALDADLRDAGGEAGPARGDAGVDERGGGAGAGPSGSADGDADFDDDGAARGVGDLWNDDAREWQATQELRFNEDNEFDDELFEGD